jgi:ABC-type dipeptide/oligopeptide/nickel transport system ATPase subunit
MGKLNVMNQEVTITSIQEEDYISLTDIAKHRNADDPRFIIQNWMRTRSTVEFLGIWEFLNNPNFNRVEFEAVKNDAGSNAFVMTPTKWVNLTGAIGIISKAGRYGGTYAHKDIAFEFASWVSVEFKLYLIKEFQRLKENVIHGAMGRTCGMKTWIQGIAPRHLREEAMTCLEKVGLTHLATSKASRLSGGESQRTAIARALMQQPRLMMADEPVASLDPKVGREIMELFINLINRENISLVYVSHDLEHALRYSDKLLGLRQGKLAIDGKTCDFTKRDLNAIYH